jgi:hypothetical protein
MALRLQDHLIEGFISGDRYSTHGVITFMGPDGRESPIIMTLTCGPGPVFQNRAIDFRAKDPSKVKPLPRDIEPIQVGVPGDMLLRMAKIPRIPIEEWDHKSPLEFDWELCLYLEWYSQNGRIVIELVDPVIHLRAGKPLEIPEIPEEGVGGFSFFVVQEKPGAHGGTAEYEATSYSLVDDDDDDDDDLESYLERLNRERDAAAGMDDDDDDLFDIDGAQFAATKMEGEILGSLLRPQQLPAPHDVSEEEAEVLLRSLLIELALYSVGVNLCHHCTMKESYRYLLETVLQEGRVDTSMEPHGWVRTFNYSDTCADCQAELEMLKDWANEGFPERDWSQLNRDSGETGDTGETGDEDLPF